MAEDPNHPWGTGATRYFWRADVRRNVQLVLARYSAASANTYVCHPWCGWGPVSVDFWGPGGRGDPLRADLGPAIGNFLAGLAGPPMIRHTIWQHWLWTSWGGYSWWAA